jgi:hypothetical protein
MASNDDMHAIGKLGAGMAGVSESLDTCGMTSLTKGHAHESRAVTHQRLDLQAGKIGNLETTVALSGQIDAQLRDSVSALDETVKRN